MAKGPLRHRSADGVAHRKIVIWNDGNESSIGASPIIDSDGSGVMRFKDGTDPTKILEVDLSGLTTATTSTLDLALTAYSEDTSMLTGAVQTLFTTPVELVPAPGAGKYIEIVSIHWFLDYGTAAYDAVAAGDDLVAKYTNAAGAAVCASVAGVGFGDQTSDQHRTVYGIAVTPVANAAVVAHILVGEWYGAAGDSPLFAEVIYRVRTFTLTA